MRRIITSIAAVAAAIGLLASRLVQPFALAAGSEILASGPPALPFGGVAPWGVAVDTVGNIYLSTEHDVLKLVS